MDSVVAEAQREMLARMAALDPPPFLMGGYAEDALLAGEVTRQHEDIDWLLPRQELALRRAQAEALGFGGFEVWGEAAPGEPFYLFCQGPECKLDLGICDAEDGGLWMKVHRLAFTVGCEEAPAGFRARMPDDTFAHPPARIGDLRVRVASPLALYQMRVALAARGSFGELSPRQRDSARALRERFLPGRTDDDLAPVVESLT